MDDFNKDINTNDAQEFEDAPKTQESVLEDKQEAKQSFFDNIINIDEPVWNKVEYTPVEKQEDNKPMGTGFKVFCAVIAGVIALTATTSVGYFYGKKSAQKNIKTQNYIGQSVEVDLAAKPADTDQKTAAQVYAQVNESIVGIKVYNEAGNGGSASGVIYSEDGFVVTNDHIYASIGAAQFKVYMHDGKEYDAEYVAGDNISDLAVLKIKCDKDEKFKAATFGDSEQVINGEHVVAIGRPTGSNENSSITSGLVSLSKRWLTSTSSYPACFIQTDSAINPGSSGGALVNMYGQVIGITSSKISGEEIDAIGFAIPTRTMKRVVEQLIKDGQVTDRAKLGISYNEIDSVTKELNNLAATGLLVGDVSDDSDVNGILRKDDIITHVNGIEITKDDILLEIIDKSKVGDKITITVIFSDGEEQDLETTLKAKIGESSYSTALEERNPPKQNENSSGGSFNFPQGE